VLRDLEDGGDPMWSASHGPASAPAAQKSSGASLGPFVLLTVGLMLGARIWFPESGGGSPPAPAASTAPQFGTAASEPAGHDGLLEWLDGLLPGRKPVRLEMTPAERLENWTPPAGRLPRRSQWRVEGGALYPGALRLWKPTLEATDYDFSFAGRIERRALSWAWRARGAGAYYAARISLAGQKGGSPLLERIVVEGARVVSREEFPLPVPLERAKPYEITVAVRGAAFRTLLDGRLIDEWKDARLPVGGVGFYAGEGESAAILWAKFRERTSLLERLNLAVLLVPPGANL
jgi:hypothetical protein